MLTDYYSSVLVLERLRSGILAPFVEDFIVRLEDKGYTRSSVRAYLSTAAHLGFWGANQGLLAQDLDDKTAQVFLDHLAKCSCFRPNTGKFEAVPGHLRFLLECLRGLRVLGAKEAGEDPSAPPLTQEFRRWMHKNRGVTDATLRSYQPVVTELLNLVGNDLQQLKTSTVRGFILHWATHHARSSTATAAGAVRMFLRYLIIEGKIAPGLICAVPSMANWRLSSLPRYLPAEDVDRIINYWDPATELGARNRAILLLLARLGLRAGDVVALRLGDIDWAQATIRLCGKGRREALLPLTQEVGDALFAYLPYRLPHDCGDRLFIRDRAPLRPLSPHGTVSTMVARTMKRVGIRSRLITASYLCHSFCAAIGDRTPRV
jgi:integrase